MKTETQDNTQEKLDSTAQISQGSLESNVDTSFFYTNDKFLNSLDDHLIMIKIMKKYPNFNVDCSDSLIKRALVNFLKDEQFVIEILEYYNINIFDLFKILYKQYSSIFKGPFLKKLKNELNNKKYVVNERRQKIV